MTDIIERLINSGERVRIFYGDPATGIAWPEENDVIGCIGQSTGPQKIPLLIPRPGYGGYGILTANVVAVFGTKSGTPLYKHPAFNVGDWRQEGCEVFHNGEIYSRHKTPTKAANFIGFMKGERFLK